MAIGAVDISGVRSSLRQLGQAQRFRQQEEERKKREREAKRSAAKTDKFRTAGTVVGAGLGLFAANPVAGASLGAGLGNTIGGLVAQQSGGERVSNQEVASTAINTAAGASRMQARNEQLEANKLVSQGYQKRMDLAQADRVKTLEATQAANAPSNQNLIQLGEGLQVLNQDPAVAQGLQERQLMQQQGMNSVQIANANSPQFNAKLQAYDNLTAQNAQAQQDYQAAQQEYQVQSAKELEALNAPYLAQKATSEKMIANNVDSGKVKDFINSDPNNIHYTTKRVGNQELLLANGKLIDKQRLYRGEASEFAGGMGIITQEGFPELFSQLTAIASRDDFRSEAERRKAFKPIYRQALETRSQQFMSNDSNIRLSQDQSAEGRMKWKTAQADHFAQQALDYHHIGDNSQFSKYNRDAVRLEKDAARLELTEYNKNDKIFQSDMGGKLREQFVKFKNDMTAQEAYDKVYNEKNYAKWGKVFDKKGQFTYLDKSDSSWALSLVESDTRFGRQVAKENQVRQLKASQKFDVPSIQPWLDKKAKKRMEEWNQTSLANPADPSVQELLRTKSDLMGFAEIKAIAETEQGLGNKRDIYRINAINKTLGHYSSDLQEKVARFQSEKQKVDLAIKEDDEASSGLFGKGYFAPDLITNKMTPGARKELVAKQELLSEVINSYQKLGTVNTSTRTATTTQQEPSVVTPVSRASAPTRCRQIL